MSDTIIIGIDPGVTGAVAVGFASSQAPYIFDLVPEPASARGEKPGTGRQAYNLIDARRMSDELGDWIFEAVEASRGWSFRYAAFIESPLAGAANGVRVVGQVSRIIGRCEAVCAVLGAEVTIVAPPKWRGFHGIGGTGGNIENFDAALYRGNKAASLDRACELWPSLAETFRPPPPLTKGGEPSKVKPAAKDGRAEAALIWAYGRAVATRAGSSG